MSKRYDIVPPMEKFDKDDLIGELSRDTSSFAILIPFGESPL